MEIKKLSRNALKGFESYTMGGKQPKPLKEGITEYMKLNANENQLGMSPLAVEAIQKGATFANLYPAELANNLKCKIADKFEFDVDNITIMGGSSGIIHALGDAFLNTGDEVVICAPSYPAYYPMARRFGANLITVPLKEDLSYNFENLFSAINKKTKFVVVVNPNNPTGTIADNDEFDAFINKLPEHVIVIVDEAYMEWVTKPGYKDALPYVRDGKKVIVLRTFSKLYGMAGLRVGYGIAPKEIIEQLSLLEGTYGSNRLGMIGAMAGMDDRNYLKKSLENNTIGREYITKELIELGFKVYDSHTSFIFFEPTISPEIYVDELESYGVQIRIFEKIYARVSVGLPYQNEMFIKATKEIIKNI